MGALTFNVWLLVVAIVLLAMFFVVHLAILVRVFRSELPTGWKVAALLPPVAPIAAIRAGRKPLALFWGLVLLGYVCVRVLGAA